MKKILIYISILLTSATFNGCYDLNTYPGDKVNENLFYKTEEHAKQGLMGIYGMLRDNHAYGYQFLFDHLADIAYGYDYYMMYLGTYSDRSAEIQSKWQTMYDGIQRANSYLRVIPTMDVLTEEQKKEYMAEARFLRGMFYFTLLDLYGGVPYYDETTNLNVEYVGLKKPRSSA